MGESKEKLLKAIKHYQDSLERNAPKGNSEKLLHAIDKLSKLPIKVCHLEETGVGRTVNGLKKIGGEVGENARILVDKWKSMVKVEEDAEIANSRRIEEKALQKQQESHESDESEESDEDPEPNKLQICDPESSENEAVESSHQNKKLVNDNMKSHSKESKSHSKHSKSSKRRRSSEKSDSNSSEDDSDYHKSKKHKSDRHNRKSSKQSKHKKKRDSSESDSDSESESGSSHSENEKSSENEVSEREKKHKKHSSHRRDKEREDKYKKHKGDSRDHHEKSRDKKEIKESLSKEKREDKQSSSKSKDSKYKEDKREKEKDLTGRKDGHRSDEKKQSKEKERSRESSKSDKHKKRERESSSSEKSGKKSSSEKKESTSKSSKESSEAKRERDNKDKERSKSDSGKTTKDKEKLKLRPEKLVNGIDSESGTSFADALGMLGAPVYVSNKKKSSSSSSKEKKSPERGGSKEEKAGKSSGAGSSSSRVANDAGNSSKDEVPKLLKDKNNLEPLDINISTLLPSITPNYKPLSFPVDGQSKRMWTDDEALSRVISAKHQRTKVYSGNKAGYTKVPSLFDLCTRILQDNIDALEYTGGVPYSILKPILERANPDQLYQLEFHNAYLVEDTDELWQLHCQREFRTKRREELESWREMYMRCLDEREAKLKTLTANIKQSQDKSLPVRTTKLAYVDSYVKPPRNVARKQAKNGTAVEIKRPSTTPSERLGQLAKGGEAAKVAVPNPGRQAVERSSSSHSHSSNLKPKKAPLMAKTLSLLKNRFGRR